MRIRNSVIANVWSHRPSKLLCLATVAAAVHVSVASATAATITSVTAPNLTRPNDNVKYPFTINVAGTYTNFDIALNALQTVDTTYWDDDPLLLFNADDMIHEKDNGLIIPKPPANAMAGAAWASNATFEVGCTNDGEVFGPSGATGEGVMNDGYFHFDIGFFGYAFGYNTVTCGEPLGAGAMMALQPVPEPNPLLPLLASLLGLGWSIRRPC